MAAAKKTTPRKQTAKQKAANAKAKKDAEATRAKERAAAVKSGALIDGPGDTEFIRVDRDGKVGKIQERAAKLVDELGKGKPVIVRDLISKNGGQFPQYLAMFQLLEAMGEVAQYRVHGGDQAGQVAYIKV